MNRLKNYYRAKDLSKLLLNQAMNDLTVNKLDRAVRHLIEACTNLLVGQNCLVSLAFEKKGRWGKNKDQFRLRSHSTYVR